MNESIKTYFRLAVAVFFIILLQPAHSRAQERQYQFHLVKSTDNILLGKIMAIAQDPKGYLWLADDRNGLIRYDGYEMIRFKNNPSDSNSLGVTNLHFVCMGRDGKVWISGNGLDLYDPATNVFKHYKQLDKYLPDPGANIFTILVDRDGLVWLGTGNGLFCLDEKTNTVTQYLHNPSDPSSISSDMVRTLYEDRQGRIWIGTGFEFEKDNDGGLNLLADKKKGIFVRYLADPKNPQSLVNNKVNAILEDSRGVFWIGTGGDGLHTMDREKGTFTRYPYDPLHPDRLSRPPVHNAYYADHISFIQEDGAGVIWIGTGNAGLNAYDPATGKTTHFYSSNGFPDKAGWNAFTSRDGVLWISSQWDDKLYRIDPFPLNIGHVNIDRRILEFHEDEKGNLWLGTESAGLIRLNKQSPDQFETFLLPKDQTHFPMAGSVLSIQKDPRGFFWLGTADGVFTFDPSSHQFKRFDHDPTNPKKIKNFINSLSMDSRGRLWICSGGGLTELNRETGATKHYYHDPNNSGSLSTDAITQCIEDPDGNFWMSTWQNDGLNFLGKGDSTFRHYLPNAHITCIFNDASGILWVGADNGLFRYDKSSDQFSLIVDPKSQIEKIAVKGIEEDSRHNLWVASPFLLLKIDSTRKEITAYGEKYGIKPYSIDSYKQVAYKTKEGQILIAENNAGFYSLDANHLKANQAPVQLLITELYVDNKIIKPSKEGPITAPIHETKVLRLRYDQNNFALGFVGIQFSNPEENVFVYTLENYEKDWRKAGSEKSANYFKVPPGNYVFRVKATSNNGIWTERAINIIIDPPWWRTWWAYTLYGLIIIGIFITLDRIQKQRVIQAEKEKNREKELAQAKEIEKAYSDLKATQKQLIHAEKMASLGELTAGIAHEIQNPLNFVNNFSEINRDLLDEVKGQHSKVDNEEFKDLMDDIYQNNEKIIHHGKRADAIVKSMLQHSRVNVGRKELTDINALADEYLRLSYHGLRAKDKSFNCDIIFNPDPDLGKVNVVPQDIGRVLLNLINNAFYAVDERRKAGEKDYKPEVAVTTKLGNNQKNQPIGQLANELIISVNDNGNGIPEHIRNKIFQPFFTTKPTGQGTGLGLSLSYDIIKAHGGEIKVESKEGGGTTFVVLLPL